VVEDQVPLPRHFFGFRAPVMGDPRFDALRGGLPDTRRGHGAAASNRRLVREERIAQDVAFFSLGLIGERPSWPARRLFDRGVDPAVVERAFEESWSV